MVYLLDLVHNVNDITNPAEKKENVNYSFIPEKPDDKLYSISYVYTQGDIYLPKPSLLQLLYVHKQRYNDNNYTI